jgi:TetR/AcrR family transcriptional regulator, cholesterol catabolism regulator
MEVLARQPAPCPDDILAQCAALMAREGYHGTSMRDIARTTGRSLSGLYHHFSSKEELLFLINERGFASLLANAERLRERYQAAPPSARHARRASEALLRDLIGAHVGYFGSHLNEMRVLMFGTLPMSSDHGEIIRVLKQRYAEVVAFAVGEYISARQGPAGKAEIERRSFLLFGMMNWIYGWYSYDEHGSADELAEEIFATFTQGCAASRRPVANGE